MKRLAIVSTHPIQYHAPLFRMLAGSPETDVHVFYTKEEGQSRFDTEFQQDVVWDIPLTEGYAHSFIPCRTRGGRLALNRALASYRPDAILIFGWNPPGHLRCMRHFHGRIPIWFRGDSIIDSGMQGWKRPFRKAALSWVYRHVDRAFPVGRKNRDYYLWAGLAEDQLTLAPHSVDADFFTRDDTPRKEEALSIRSELGIGREDVVFLFAGKLNANKQPIELARAFSNLQSQSGSEAHLIFVGSGPLEARLKSEFGSHPRIHSVGFQNQSRMPIWYRVADILCLVSKSETWGLAINEALLCGCRIIASDTVGCVPDLVDRHPGCSVVDHQEDSRWTDAMARMIGQEYPKYSTAIPGLDSVHDAILNQLHREAA